MKDELKMYDFTVAPFDNFGGVDMYYPSPQHREAIGRALFAIKTGKPAVLVVGGYGMGKTFVKNVMIKMLSDDPELLVVSVENACVRPVELLSHLISKIPASPFGKQVKFARIRSAASLEDQMDAAARALLEQEKRRVVIMIDELQTVRDPATLEQIRLLMNRSDGEGRPLFTFILFGHHSVMDRLKDSPSFLQRVAIRWRIQPLEPAQTSEYIRHRLKRAGAMRQIFTDEALARIHELSGGCPRVINNLCDICLHFTHVNRRWEVGPDLIDAVSADILKSGMEEDASG